MFQNRISGLVMSYDNPQDRSAGAPTPRDDRASGFFPMPVQTADIYQAALNRAIQDYELDKLFNPEHYDYQI
jgi:hypothetical protein